MKNFNIESVIKALRIYQFVEQTPLQLANNLSTQYNNQIFFKREDLHPIFSFKIRGACNKMMLLNKAQRQQGVVAASAGNHAQGVAYIAEKLGIAATIVMPVSTPTIKVQSVEKMGAKVVITGDNFDQAYAHAKQLVEASNQTFIPPFDDDDIIAGQGTIALELVKQLQTIDYVFVPIGGGGLAAGISVFLKRFHPTIKVIGVETKESPTLYESMIKRKRIVLDAVGLFAEGVAVKQIGKRNYPLLTEHVDQVLLVDEDETCVAIKDIFEQTRVVVEPSGAIATAAVKRYIKTRQLTGQSIVSLVTGANMNFDRFSYIAQQANLGEGGEAILAVSIPEKKGSFLQFVTLLGQHAITEFNYRFNENKVARIFLTIKLKNYATQIDELLTLLKNEGYQALNLTKDALAKTHVRHMVGGRVNRAIKERIYSFYFPERLGALLEFLQCLGSAWNVTLFHYQNQGSGHGQVLIGFQIEKASDVARLEKKFEAVGFSFENVSNNKAYRLFLS